MQIWLVRTRTLATWAEIEQALPEHLASELALACSGDLILAGPVPTPEGGLDGDALTLYDAESESAARSLAEADPFVIGGLRRVVAVEPWDVRRVGRRMREIAAEWREL